MTPPSVQRKEAYHEDRPCRSHRFVGSGILAEALDRGHNVTAIVTHPDKLPTHPSLHGVKADVADRVDFASLVAGHNVVISAFNPGKDERDTGTRSIIDAVNQSGVARLVVVGGAGPSKSRRGSAWSTSSTSRPNGRTDRSRPRPSSTICAARPS